MTEPVYDGRNKPLLYGEHAGLFFRTHTGNKGDVLEGHEHYQDHWTFLFSGSVRVRYKPTLDGEPEKTAVFIAPYAFVIKAEVFHEVMALEDNTVWQCVFVQPENQSGPDATYHRTK